MTVIKRVQQNYNYPNSTNASDTESLHLGSATTSDAESVNNEPILPNRRPFRPPPVRPNQIEDLVHIRKHSGKKKTRRYFNSCDLVTLKEEDEEDDVTIMEPYKSPFTRLLEDNDALEYWHKFIQKSEEEQKKIVQSFSEKYTQNQDNESPTKSEKPFARISAKIRRTIKIRKNLSLESVKSCEDDLIHFFKATPNEVYIKHPPTSFDRLLLHAIAQYHGLKSIVSGIVVNGQKKSVEIYNANSNWIPAECFLTDFIAQLRSQ